MTLDAILRDLGEDAATAALAPHWEESAATFAGADLGFLEPAHIAEARQWCGFGPDADAPLLDAASRVRGNSELLRLAWHCHELLFRHLDYTGTARWPSLQSALGSLSGAFHLLVVLAMVPRVRALHHERGVSDEVSRDTCRQVSDMAGNYRRMTGGGFGITLNTIEWMRNYTAGRLFRIGRMEYMLRPFGSYARAYRHRGTGATVALAADDSRFGGDGYLAGEGSEPGSGPEWTASFVEDDRGVTGYPIHPAGYAVQREVRLASEDWECVLRLGDAMLDMHIPPGGEMSPDRCADSMRRAVPFFRELFPDEPFRAIACISWIFGTQFEEIHLSSDNLVRFQRELYLFPVPSWGEGGLWFVFLQSPIDLQRVPRDTSLRRAVAEYLDTGRQWRAGGMFFLTEDLDRLGTQHYRANWPPPALPPIPTAGQPSRRPPAAP